jgi:hypothetical protein
MRAKEFPAPKQLYIFLPARPLESWRIDPPLRSQLQRQHTCPDGMAEPLSHAKKVDSLPPDTRACARRALLSYSTAGAVGRQSIRLPVPTQCAQIDRRQAIRVAHGNTYSLEQQHGAIRRPIAVPRPPRNRVDAGKHHRQHTLHSARSRHRTSAARRIQPEPINRKGLHPPMLAPEIQETGRFYRIFGFPSTSITANVCGPDVRKLRHPIWLIPCTPTIRAKI